MSTNIRSAVAELSKKMAAGNQEMSWLTWAARYSPHELTQEYLENYDKQMKIILSELVGLRVVVAALDSEIHALFIDKIGSLYDLDIAIAKAKSLYFNSKNDGVKALAEIFSSSPKFEQEFVEFVTTINQLKKYN